MKNPNLMFPSRKKLWASFAALCLLGASALAQDKPAASVSAFRNDMRLVAEYEKTEDGRKMAEVLSSAKPVAGVDHFELALALERQSGLIAATQGPAEALKLFELVEKKIKLPDPNEMAKDAVAAEGNIRALSPDEIAAFDLKNTTGKSPEEKLAFYAKNAAEKAAWIARAFSFARAKLLEGDGQHDQAIAVIEKYLKTPGHSAEMDKNARRVLGQYRMVGSMVPTLKPEQTLGSFPGLETLRGKVVLLDFTAHWCGPCQKAVPGLINIYTKFHDQGLEIFGVTGIYGFFGYGKDRKVTPEVELVKVRALNAEKGVLWPMVVISKENQAEFQVEGIPHVFLIDRKGVIRRFWVGFLPGHGHEQAVQQAVEKLLREPVAQNELPDSGNKMALLGAPAVVGDPHGR